MSKNENTVRINTGSHGRPPKHTMYKPGQTGNGRGRPKAPDTLAGLFDREIHKERSVNTGRKRMKLTAKELMVRSLVESAAKGDRRALTELVELITTYGEGLDYRHKLTRVPFETATQRPKAADKFEDLDKFFAKQDRDLKKWRQELREAQPMAALLKRELDRKIDGTRAGKPTKISMRQAIVARFIKDGTQGTTSVLKTLLTVVPEKKVPVGLDVVERPTAEEKERWLQEQAEEHRLNAERHEELMAKYGFRRR